METSRGKLAVRGALTVALACSFAVAPAVVPAVELSIAPSPWLAVDRNRSGITADIVSRWDEVTKTGKTGVLAEGELREALGKLRADQLFSASLAGSYPALLGVLMDAGALSDGKPGAKPQQKVAGSGPELVYTPITPCRIADSRRATGGSFTGGAVRNWLASNPAGSFVAQGGSTTNCGIPVKARAAAMNFTVFNTGQGPAYIVAWPFNQPQPGTATLNWVAAGSQVANSTIVPLCAGAGCTADFSVFSTTPTDMVVDVVGYFTQPTGGYVLTVAPSGAQYTSIQAAIDAAAPLASPTQRYLVKVAPGSYTEQITLKNWVDVEGAGFLATQVTWSASRPTVKADAAAELRKMFISNDAAGQFPAAGATAVEVTGASGTNFARLVELNVWAVGPGDNIGVAVRGGALQLHRSDVIAGRDNPMSTGQQVALLTANDGFVRMRDSRLFVPFNPSASPPFTVGRRSDASSMFLVNTGFSGHGTEGAPKCFSTYWQFDNSPAACN